MFRLILPLIISISLFAQSISLVDLAFIVQKKDKVNIIFSNDVPKTVLVDFPIDYAKSSYMPFFRSVIQANNLTIKDNDGIFLVSTAVAPSDQAIPGGGTNLLAPPALVNAPSLSAPLPPMLQGLTPGTDYKFSFVSHKLDYLQFDNIKSLLEFSELPYSYSPVSKTITFKDNGKNTKLIKKLIKEIKSIDVLKEQVTLKITIFDTNLNKLRQVGINPNLTFDFDLLSKTGALLTGSSIGQFKGSLAFLQNSGVTKVTQSTSYLISDSDELNFKKVVSIPFLDENFALSNQVGTNQSQKYKYRDVGFKVLVTPTIVGENVYLDFSLSVENVLTSGNLPTTSQNAIVNKFSVKKGDIVLLAGISKNSIIETKDGLPFLESIPFFNDIFTKKSNSNTDDTFNVSIEIL